MSDENKEQDHSLSLIVLLIAAATFIEWNAWSATWHAKGLRGLGNIPFIFGGWLAIAVLIVVFIARQWKIRQSISRDRKLLAAFSLKVRNYSFMIIGMVLANVLICMLYIK